MTPTLRALLAPAAVLALAAPGAAPAHHSFSAEFDPESEGEVTGVVTQVRFTNPHVRYRLDVPVEAGGTEEWELQMASPTTLRRAGWVRDTLGVGDEITARGQLGRDGAQKLYIRGVRTADGRELSAYGGERDDPNVIDADPDADYGYGRLGDHPADISGLWRNSYRFRVTVDDLEPKPIPFTDEGRRVFEATEHIEDPSLRCMAPGLPRIFGAPYNMEIVDAGSHYLIVHVERNTPRRVYMDGREPPADQPASSLGFSVGHWEDDRTLVIETTHLLPGWLDGSGLPMSGEGTRIVERWVLSEDRLAMDRTMTIHDPYYTEPLVRERGSARGDDVEIVEQPSCDPDSYYLDLLEGGRLEEWLTR